MLKAVEISEKDSHEKLVRDIMLNKSLDGFFYGLSGLVMIVSFNRLIISLPVELGHFLYLFPLGLILFSVKNIPADAYPSTRWKKSSSRLKWSALIVAGLSPFWGWWQEINDRLYLLINMILLILSSILLLFNLVSIIIFLAKENKKTGTFYIAQFTRLAIIYLLIGPVAAFFTTAIFLFGKSSGGDIFTYFILIESWKFLILGIPVFLTLWILFVLRKEYSRKLTSSNVSTITEKS